jgi:hypothetical protein
VFCSIKKNKKRFDEKMNQEKLIKKVNEAWDWIGISAKEIKMINEFGNIVTQSEIGKYYRLCPEELSFEKIAETEKEFNSLKRSSEFQEDWQMINLVNIAKEKFGELGMEEKFCLKIPAVIGGEYTGDNIGKISFDELISFSGDLAFQIKDLDDGQKIELKIKN